MTLKSVFAFPHPANDIAARVVAGMVVLLSAVIIVLDIDWLLALLTYGFLARVLAGPNLSPMGLLATRVIVPTLGNPYKPVAGPPKQFAQAVGLLFSTSALILTYGFGLGIAAKVVLGVLLLFASLESFAGFCAGCFVFGYLMRWGLISQKTCERCANFSPSAPT